MIRNSSKRHRVKGHWGGKTTNRQNRDTRENNEQDNENSNILTYLIFFLFIVFAFGLIISRLK